VFFSACGGSITVITNPPAPGPTFPVSPPLPTPSVSFRVETVVPSANFPVSLAFTPDGRLFYTELQSGNVRIVSNGQLQAQPFVTVTVLASGEQGLLGLALDPNFASNRFVYIYYTHPNPPRNRIVRYTDSSSGATNETVIADNLPTNGNHIGGRLVFGPDGLLYITQGDIGSPANAQSRGNIFRYNTASTLPVGQVFALGLRNPFGLAFHPATGTAYASDNGPNCDDEVNRVVLQGNYGWRPAYPCGDTDPQYRQPGIRFNPVIAPTGISFYRGNVFPEWRSHLFMTSFNDGLLRRFVVNELGNGEALETQVIINGGFGSLIDVCEGTDGNLYVAAQGAILRVVRQ
jgi:glucose/arabinose dehydrogenase